ncbi:helix-turn-helix domain-containing protein [Amycolatopsis sp. DSM 110486]|uniref:helix-turn-helix domain-containing protein n=1 Tax=Amycolatopsis sp. DSM 110486 TaxID=2865832 RepID=UPI001C69D753|nr:XRE family transcriptional regulator [Amycolatopsis sp. DSM 110486]QYN25181.1 XRE family transcriptional regulator [Amycolatopsis sp. DSM 110486]
MATDTGRAGEAGALVGAAVRAARTRSGLSTRDLAARAGISQPFLSQLERGLHAPSVNTLYRLAEALAVSPADLLPALPASPIRVVRAADRRLDALNERPETAYSRTARGSGAIAEIIEYIAEPGQDIDGWFWRDSDEALIVLEGRLRVDFEGEESVRLDPGDCLFHPGTTRHRWARVDEDRLRVVLIVAGDR